MNRVPPLFFFFALPLSRWDEMAGAFSTDVLEAGGKGGKENGPYMGCFLGRCELQKREDILLFCSNACR